MNHVEATRSFLPYLEAWFGQIMLDLHGRRADPGQGLLMACPIWGDAYLERFQRYCLPTMMAPENRAALQDNCRMILFTSRNSAAGISTICRGLRAMKIDARPQVIPDDVMEQLKNHPLNKYWILGVIGNAGVQIAGDAGMGYHMLLPDHMYAERYFPNLTRLSLTHQGIAQTGISARTAVLEEMEGYRATDETIAISGQILGDMGYRHLHKQTKASLMNDASPSDLPHSHLLTWQARDKLILHCPHMNAAYLSPEMCAKAPTRIPATLDAELPAFFPKDFYVPPASDGMTFIEVSDDRKADDPRRVSFREFAMHCWVKVRFQTDWMPYFKTPCEVPIVSRETFVDEEEIDRQFNMLLDGMYKLRPELAYEFIGALAFK